MHAGVVHQHVDRLVSRGDLRGRRAHRGERREIELDEGDDGSGRSRFADALRSALSALAIAAEHHQRRPHSGERRGGSEAKPPRRSGDHAHAAEQIDDFARGLAPFFAPWSIHLTCMSPLTVVLAVVLLIGTALHGIGALMHPVLAGDGATQLRIIADMPHWRDLHLAMLAGSGLIVAGVWVRLVDDRAFVRAPLVAALMLISLGVTINALNIAYMAGAGWHVASRFVAGDAGMVALFDATHPIGLMAARFGNFIIALGAVALGWGEWRDPEPRRLDAALAWIAGIGGIVGAVFFAESSRLALAAVGLLSGWQVVTAGRALILSAKRTRRTMIH